MKQELRAKLNSIDLFAGAGGLALGIHNAGFSSVGLVELNRHAYDTLRINADSLRVGTRWPVVKSDVRFVEYSRLSNGVDLLAAGAPCQPFSLGGRHRGDEDKRNMFPEVFRAIRILRPKAILLENVRGLTRQSFRPYFEYILAQLSSPHEPPRTGEGWTEHLERLRTIQAFSRLDSDEEYDVHWQVLNSANYGVPQKRERVIMVAFRRDLGIGWDFPEPTHSEDRLLYEQFVSGEYWAHHIAKPKPPDAKLSKRIDRLNHNPPMDLPWQTLRHAVSGLPEPQDMKSNSEWSFHIGIPGARLYKGHTGNNLDKPAKTIKAGDHGNPGGEHVMLKDDGSIRYMTVRECARVQTFPDAYQFSGSRTEAMRQIGNAVPVLLAETLASSIRAVLLSNVAEKQPVSKMASVGQD